MVIAGTCLAEGRRAVFQVEEVLKGDVPSSRVVIAYRMQNWERNPGEPKIEFRIGERCLLVLRPEEPADGRPVDEPYFLLAGGPDGKVEVPAEGSEVLLEASRRMVRIQSLPNQSEVWDEHRKLLVDRNPLLVEAGFQEVIKFRLGTQDMLPVLSAFLQDPRDAFRISSLQVLAQFLESCRRREASPPIASEITREVLSVARGDASPEVRAQAIRTLRAAGRADLREVLQQVADKDPSQLVRYEARRTLLESNHH